jgi:hypothetical protein
MKRLTILVVFVLVLAPAASAQWKDYEWGMTPDQVRAEQGPAELKDYSEGDNRSTLQYRDAEVLGAPAGASFLFEGNSLVAIILFINAQVHDRAVAVFDDRYLKTYGGYLRDQYVSYKRDLMVEVTSDLETTEIYYSSRSWFLRTQEQQRSKDSQEL